MKSNLKQSLYFVLVIFSIFSNASNLLATNHDSMIFVILRHVRTEYENTLWKRCYNSIREFYLDTPIIIIDDNSKLYIPDENLPNTCIIRSEYPGAGELLPYYYFHKYRWASKMIFLHDSMFLRRPFNEIELNNSIKFHWHFETHLYDDNIRINGLLLNLKHGNLLVSYNKDNKKLWHGCFGVASIIDIDVLDQIENDYLFLDLLIDKIKCREDRCALERIFGILLFKSLLIRKETCSNFGDISNYPHSFHNFDANWIEHLKLFYHGAILKTWHGR